MKKANDGFEESWALTMEKASLEKVQHIIALLNQNKSNEATYSLAQLEAQMIQNISDLEDVEAD